MSSIKWTKKEEEMLIRMLSDEESSWKDILDALHRSHSSVKQPRVSSDRDNTSEIIKDTKEIVEKVVGKLEKRKRMEARIPSRTKLIPETWVNMFSDLHYGLLVKPLEVEGMSEYNTKVARARVEYLLQTLKRILEYFPNRPRTLVVPFLGDMIDNSIMRGNQRSNIELNAVDQVIYVTEIIVDYITELTRYFPIVKCYGVYGNHGRITRGIKDSAPAENFDKVVYWAVKKRIENYKNVSFDYTEAQHMIADVNGWKFWLEHGDSVRGWAGIPFYGAKREKSNIGEMLGIFSQYADYVLMGHHHQPAHFNNIFINGAFIGGDLYSIGKLRRMSLPSQTLLGVNRKHGVVWQRDITLIDNPKNLKLRIYE